MPEARPDVAIVLYSAKLTGARKQKIRLAGGLARRGLRVELVLVRARGVLLEAVDPSVRVVGLEGRAVRAVRLLGAGSRGAMAAALPGLVAYVRQTRPRVLMGANTPASLLCGPAHALARARETRSVLCVTNHLSGSGAPGARLELAFARRALARADAIVPVGEAVARDLAEHLPGAADRIRTIHNPVLPDDWKALCAAPAPHPWLEDGGPPVVLGCGRLEPQKDFATLLRAFARLRRDRPVRLVVMGSGPEAPALCALADSLGVAADVDLPGQVANPLAAMARADLLALSSRWEGLPNVVIEALAAGCPVVATDAPGGAREALCDGALGPLVPPRDPEALALAMARTLDAPPDRDARVARGEVFSASRSVSAYLALFEELAGRAST
ncbi:MAG TPA: glycosyltransferase [Myxococcota bacterium]|nr:glycosyltransferase [Myxococcota bacterium]